MKDFYISDFKNWNEKMVRKYDPDCYHHHLNPMVRYIETKRVRKVIDFLALKKEESLLEVGCGAGNILERLDCSKIVGVDISLYILGKAMHKNIKHIQFINADVESLPLRDQSFNKIICSEVLEHVLHPHKALVEIWRVLKSEGMLIISIPNENLINFIKKILIKLKLFGLIFSKDKEALSYDIPNDMAHEWHLHKLNFKKLSIMLKNYFVVIRYKSIPFSFLPFRYVVQCRKI